MKNTGTTTDPWPGDGLLLSDRYRLERCIATGAAGTVWLAVDERLARAVAIKLLLPHRAADAVAVERFQREALATVKAAHLNAVRVYDAARDGQYSYTVMEYVEGGPLSDLAGLSLPHEVVAALGAQVAAALGAAHDMGLVHRDVKPGNILIAEDGWIKVVDFGIAKALDSGSNLTQTEMALGTARYLAPEQLMDAPITPAADVYSLGLVLWESLTGATAFAADTAHASALARLHRDLEPLDALAPEAPRELVDAISTATQRDPSQRFQHGSEFADALTTICGPRPYEITRRLADLRHSIHYEA